MLGGARCRDGCRISVAVLPLFVYLDVAGRASVASVGEVAGGAHDDEGFPDRIRCVEHVSDVYSRDETCE